MSVDEEEAVVFELPPPPRNLPKPQPEWAAISTSSTRFAVATLRKASKITLNRCRKLISTSKETERLESELDRVARQVKHDMSLAKVPRTLLKDRRIAALEDIRKSVEKMSKKLKVSRFMETYLSEIRDEKKQHLKLVENDIGSLQAEETINDIDGLLFPSIFEISTRANRACPPSFARPRETPSEQQLQNVNNHVTTATSAFLYYCRFPSDNA